MTYTWNSRHAVKFAVLLLYRTTSCSIINSTLTVVARNQHTQHVLDAYIPVCSMVWRRFMLPSGLNRFSVNRFKPAEKNRFKPVFGFENNASLAGFRFFILGFSQNQVHLVTLVPKTVATLKPSQKETCHWPASHCT